MEDPREFHNAQPRSREEREAGNDKDSFEKLRLQQRTGGFYSPNCVPNPVAAVQESSQYATEAERFNRDFARDEYERRKAKNLAEEERLARKRYEVYEREKDRCPPAPHPIARCLPAYFSSVNTLLCGSSQKHACRGLLSVAKC